MRTKQKLFSAIFLMEIVYGLFILTASIMATRVIDSRLVLGLTGTFHLVTRITSNYIFGRLSDRLGRKRLVLIGCGIILLSYLSLWPGTMGAIFLAYFLGGIGNAIYWPLVQSWMGQGTDPKNLFRSMAVFCFGVAGGLAAGNLCGGGFMSIGPYLSIGVGVAVLSVISTLIILTPDDKSRAIETGTGEEMNAAGPAPEIALAQRDRYRLIGWIANFSTWITIGVIRFLFPKLCKELNIDSLTIGEINALFYFIWALLTIGLYLFRGWMYRMRPLLFAQLIGVAALLTIGIWPGKTVFFVNFALFGLCAGMTYFSSAYYGQNGSVDKGHKSALHEMVLGSGMLLGPFVGGVVAQCFGMIAPFFFAAGAVFVAIIIEMMLAGRIRTRIHSF